MNKQGKLKNGKVVGGIEWTKTTLPNGTERQGYTWNPVGGCLHGCRWKMPDGTIAICYAEEAAHNIAQRAYPHGFEHHYWRPHQLEAPLKLKEPVKIFLDSMSDLMGHWVPDEQIEAVLNVARQAHWHTFQLLTKNAPRLLKFDFPKNVWLGVSSSPDYMFGKQLPIRSQRRMLHKTLQTLSKIEQVTWVSFEPLSWDVSEIVAQYPEAINWAVIGAATNGPKRYQPAPVHVERLLNVLDNQGVPVFFKGNLLWDKWREDFPDIQNQNSHKLSLEYN
jgi:protein gp37